jgi:heme-degrading monooxygenase HmoA
VYLIVWEFRPAAGREAEFERAYSPTGDWARFFEQDPAYRGTQLLRDARDPARFLTVDRWTSREAFEAFEKREAAGYHELDQRLAACCASETRIGGFTTTD